MLSVMIAAAVVSCGAQKSPQTNSSPAPVTSAAPAAAAGPRIIFPDGFVIRVEIASDEPTREQGLMYRDHLADDAGMIFFFPKTDEYAFWMKNTLIPLDIIWLDEQKRVVHVGPNIPPCKADPCPNYPPNAQARYVLEVAAGVAPRHGIANGSVLRFAGLDGVVIR
jgi:uncharacterized membrane protein (UPF0127 family)